MDTRIHQKLLENTEALRKLVSSYSTETIVGSCASYVFTRTGSDHDKPSELSSQFRQLFFLLGIMLSTPEPEEPKPFGESEWKTAVTLLEEIFSAYSWMFWPKPEEIPTLTDEWRRAREVAMPAFLHYFNTALLASVEQISDRIRQYLSPFDNTLEQLMGVSASDALNITSWVSHSIQKQSDDLLQAAHKTEEHRLALTDRATAESWSEERFWQESRKGEVLRDVERMVTGLQNIFKIRIEDVKEEFGADKATAFWQAFVAERGEVSDFKYLTERNVAEEKPLFAVSEGVAFCPLTNALYAAVLEVGEQQLLNSPQKAAFLKKRDKALELEIEVKLRSFFGNSATFFAGVYETPDLHYEHDLIILWSRRLFIIEAKASPPTEPFRDPDKAFVRIKRAFQSDAGIQKAFEQANRIRKQIALGNAVDLYDARHTLVTRIEPEDVDQVYLICVTRDDFGALSVDLSLLLEKEAEDPYPWAVNTLDLEVILDAWSYFNWGPEKLCEYLDSRIKLHGKIFTTDELDVAGCFIRHGSLRHLLTTDAHRIILDPTYSDVFDKIYLTRHGGEEVKYEPVKPVMTDMRKEIFGDPGGGSAPQDIRGKAGPSRGRAKRQLRTYKNKIGRGAPCPCQSGKTYSRCCGKRGA